MNQADVYDVLTAVAAGTGREIGETDVQLWATVLGDCPKQFALEAVLAHFRDKPGVWLEPGHVYSRWRDYRRDQIAREDDALREARQAALDARLVPLDELAEAKAIPEEQPKFFRRSQTGPSALSVSCPWCKAMAGHACRIPGTHMPLTKTPAHPARVELAEEKHQEESA